MQHAAPLAESFPQRAGHWTRVDGIQLLNDATNPTERLRVLIVSQSDDERAWMRAALASEPFAVDQIGECTEAEIAAELMDSGTVDIVLIDTSAEDVALLARQSQGAAIFFVAKPDNPASPEEVLAAGAADYLARGVVGLDSGELQQAMRQGLRFHKINRERAYFAEILRERDRQVAQLTMLINRSATLDPRTGWPQHQQIVERLRDELRRAARYNLPLSALIVEVEGIAALHADHGPEVADAATVEIADRIKTVARKTDICGHYGAESFLVLLTNTERDGSLIFCQRVSAIVEAPFQSPTGPVTLRCWFGLGEFAPESRREIAELLATASERLQRARQKGIHGIVLAD